MAGWKSASLALALTLLVAILNPPTIEAAIVVVAGDATRANQTSDCVAHDGTVIPLGQDRLYTAERECTILRCSAQGLDKLVAECVAPRCLNPSRKPGACCLSCPDGFNCRLPNGDLLPAGRAYTYNTSVCVCPTISTGLGWDMDLANAVCRPLTTTPAPTTPPAPSCPLPDGGRLVEGEGRVEGREDGGCRRYECWEGGRLVVKYWDCPALDCPNPVRRAGECCLSCPDDPDRAAEPETYVTSPAPPRQSRLKLARLGLSTLLKAVFQGLLGISPPAWGLPKEGHPHHRPSHPLGNPNRPHGSHESPTKWNGGSVHGIGGSMPGIGGSMPGIGGFLLKIDGSMPKVDGSMHKIDGSKHEIGGSKHEIGGFMPGIGGSMPGIGGFMHIIGGSMHKIDESKHEIGGSMHKIDGSKHEIDGSKHEIGGSMLKIGDSLHGISGSKHETGGSMHGSGGSLHGIGGSKHETGGSMHGNGGFHGENSGSSHGMGGGHKRPCHKKKPWGSMLPWHG